MSLASFYSQVSWQTQDRRPEQRWREFARFIVSGLINLLLTYVVYLALLVFLPYSAAYTGSYVCGVLISYVLNARFVFKQKLRLSKALQYPAVYLVQYLLGMALLYLLVEVGHIRSASAPLLIPFITVPVTYLLSRYLIKGRSSRIP